MEYAQYEILIYHGEDMKRELQKALAMDDFINESQKAWDDESEQTVFAMFDGLDA